MACSELGSRWKYTQPRFRHSWLLTSASSSQATILIGIDIKACSHSIGVYLSFHIHSVDLWSGGWGGLQAVFLHNLRGGSLVTWLTDKVINIFVSLGWLVCSRHGPLIGSSWVNGPGIFPWPLRFLIFYVPQAGIIQQSEWKFGGERGKEVGSTRTW